LQSPVFDPADRRAPSSLHQVEHVPFIGDRPVPSTTRVPRRRRSRDVAAPAASAAPSPAATEPASTPPPRKPPLVHATMPQQPPLVLTIADDFSYSADTRR